MYFDPSPPSGSTVPAVALEFDGAMSHPARDYADWRDRLLLSLAIAAPATPAQIGQIHLQVSLPLPSGQWVDGVVAYEQLDYVLESAPGDRPRPTEQTTSSAPGSGTAATATHASVPTDRHRPGYTTLTRCQSQLQTLAKFLTDAQALAILTEAGFSLPDIRTILTLPCQAWHKSWWYPVTANGAWGLPFQRWLRSRHHPNGTYTLQYQDHFAQAVPTCFRSRTRRVLLAIHDPATRVGDSLAKIIPGLAKLPERQD